MPHASFIAMALPQSQLESWNRDFVPGSEAENVNGTGTCAAKAAKRRQNKACGVSRGSEPNEGQPRRGVRIEPRPGQRLRGQKRPRATRADPSLRSG
jgi:hypothetical protein